MMGNFVRQCCRHCCMRIASCARGLCYPCYHTLSIRNRYSAHSLHGKLGVLTENHDPGTPSSATQALPGTEEKVVELERRAAAGQGLWHPEDAEPEDGRYGRFIAEGEFDLHTTVPKFGDFNAEWNMTE